MNVLALALCVSVFFVLLWTLTTIREKLFFLIIFFSVGYVLEDSFCIRILRNTKEAFVPSS